MDTIIRLFHLNWCYQSSEVVSHGYTVLFWKVWYWYKYNEANDIQYVKILVQAVKQDLTRFTSLCWL